MISNLIDPNQAQNPLSQPADEGEDNVDDAETDSGSSSYEVVSDDEIDREDGYRFEDWERGIQSGREVFYDVDDFKSLKGDFPLTVSFVKSVMRKLGVSDDDAISREVSSVGRKKYTSAVVRYVSRKKRPSQTITLVARCPEIVDAVREALLGVDNMFTCRQVVLNFGESYDDTMRQERSPVILNSLTAANEEQQVSPQFKKRRVVSGSTTIFVTPSDQHEKVQQVFHVLVAKHMELRSNKEDQRNTTVAASLVYYKETIEKVMSEIAYLQSRLKKASWVQLTDTLGFLTETPQIYDASKRVAVAATTPVTSVELAPRSPRSQKRERARLERIMNGYRLKNQRHPPAVHVGGKLEDPPTDIIFSGSGPRMRAAERIKRKRKGDSVQLNYQ